MGTASKITEKKIRKRIRWGAYVIIPFLSLGMITLSIQLFFSPFSSDFMNMNFDLGKLWPWANAEEKTEYVVEQETPEIITSRPRSIESRTTSREDLLKQVSRIQKVVKSKSLKNVNDELDEQEEEKVYVPALDIKPVNLESLERYEPSYGQVDLTEKEYLISRQIQPSKSRFAIGVAFAPSSSFRTIGVREGHKTEESSMLGKREDRAILNFSAGLEVFYHVNSRITLQSGLYYSSMGEQVFVLPTSQQEIKSGNQPKTHFAEYETAYESPQMVEHSGQEYHDQDIIPFNNYYGSFEIPLLINYRISKNTDVNVDLQTGLSYTYLQHTDALIYDFQSDLYYWVGDKKFEYYNNHNSNLYLGFTLSQYIAPSVEIFANPQLRYTLFSTFNKDYPITQHQYSAGVRLGMKVSL